MTANDFRRLALGLPEATEEAHMNHPDFRVRGKIFATLWADGETGMVKLRPEQQATFIDAEPDVFQPAKGAWGRGGATLVCLSAAKKNRVEQALVSAWRNIAPKRLSEGFREP